MKTRKVMLGAWICGSILCACGGGQKQNTANEESNQELERIEKQAIPTINLSAPENTETALSEIADSIVYYPIILEKECRTPKHIELLSNTIWANYYLKDLSDQKGCLFDRTNGNLLNQMSFGPVLNKKKYAIEEYSTNSYFVFNDENWLTTPPATNAKARSYTLDVATGQEIEAVPFSVRDIKSSAPQRINDSTFLVVTDLVTCKK